MAPCAIDFLPVSVWNHTIKIRHAATHGEYQSDGVDHSEAQSLTRVQLSKEDEATVGNEDLEVRREDQDKINKFSRLHQREMLLEEDLNAKAVCPFFRSNGETCADGSDRRRRRTWGSYPANWN